MTDRLNLVSCHHAWFTQRLVLVFVHIFVRGTNNKICSSSHSILHFCKNICCLDISFWTEKHSVGQLKLTNYCGVYHKPAINFINLNVASNWDSVRSGHFSFYYQPARLCRSNYLSMEHLCHGITVIRLFNNLLANVHLNKDTDYFLFQQ